MNYTDIHTFLVIAVSPSLSKAAETLYISQPALSHRLSNLEQELGSALIVRHKGVRTLELTDAGRRFVPIAKKWEQLWMETQKIDIAQPQTPLRISTVDSLNVYLMPHTSASFLKTYPSCKLNLITMRSNEAYRAVENHQLDLSFVTNPHFFKKVQTLPLFQENMAFICAIHSSYGESLLPSELNTDNEIYIPWSNTFLMWHDYWFGPHNDSRVSLDNMSLLKHFLQLKDAWAIVPSTVAHVLIGKGGFRTATLKDAPEPRMCYAILKDQRKASPMVKAFIEELLKTSQYFPEVTIVGEKYRT